jgi:hypothetical protein
MDIQLANRVKESLFVDVCEELNRRGVSGGWMANAERADYKTSRGSIVILCRGLEVDITVRSDPTPMAKIECAVVSTAYNNTFNIADPESFNKIVDWIMLRYDDS